MKLAKLLAEQTAFLGEAMKVADLDYEPTLEAIKKISDEIGLNWENVQRADINMYGDFKFKVTNIHNHSIHEFSVDLLDDESTFTVNVPNSAKMSVPNNVTEKTESSRLKELAGIGT